MDPWTISYPERCRHFEQFNSLGPIAGFVTGIQAKGFFMQSGLSPIILAQIWGLADMNGDGRMDILEFSIACKLITNKLKGLELPPSIPSSMMIPPHAPNSLPLAGVTSLPRISMAQPAQMMVSQPAQMMVSQPGMMVSQPGMMVSQPGMMGSQTGMMMTQPGMILSQPMMTTQMMPSQIMGQQPQMMGQQPQMMGQQPQMMVAMTGSPVLSGLNGSDWGVPASVRAKYAATFNITDRARTGFVAGNQARNILLQSGLPQPVLAQIWSLGDVDGDNKLSLEEFILCGYLCDLAQKGEPLPSVLPLDLIPPSSKKGRETSVSTPGSSQSVNGSEDLNSPSTFEDKRRENFNKGQAELDRRRQSIIENQKREAEERVKKEEREREEREKQRIESEKSKLLEWENQRKNELKTVRQREQEKVLFFKAKHENLKVELENKKEKYKSLTLQINETRSGVTDVKSFIDGLRESRDSKMKNLTGLKERLKAQNARLLSVTQEKAKLEAKVKDTSHTEKRTETQIECSEFERKKNETEALVNEYKMRLSLLKEEENKKRSQYETNKQILEEHREQLHQIIDSCKSLYSKFDEERREVKAEKAKRIRELTDPDAAWGPPIDSFNFSSHREPMIPSDSTSEYIKYKAIYDFEASNNDELSFSIGDIIRVHSEQVHEPGWLGGEMNGVSGWFPEAYVEKLPNETNSSVEAENIGRVLWNWTPRQSSELSLQTGDFVVIVKSPQNESGSVSQETEWSYGRLKDSLTFGYFPSSYVTFDKLLSDGSTPTQSPEINTESPLRGTEIQCLALYSYSSPEPGDLSFEAGEVIFVTYKGDSDWWTGHVGDRSGVFPYNYVEEIKEESRSVDSVDKDQELVVDQDVKEEDKSTKGSHSESSLKKQNKKRNDSEETDKEGGIKALEIAIVLAPYEASSKAQLSLTKGQMILIKKKMAKGWWQGEIQQGIKGKKRQVGWFPANYVKVVSRQPMSHVESSGLITNVSSGEEEPFKKEEMTKDKETKTEELKYKALFPYKAQHEDELGFEADDIITLISKVEESWWKGSINGLVGVFPSNYVEPLQYEYKERNGLLQELFDTEFTYLDSLKTVLDLFYNPLSQTLLSPEEIKSLFINWREIMVASNRLYKALKVRRKMSFGNSYLVGDILCQTFPEMTCYIRFCASQLNASTYFSNLIESKSGFSDFLKGAQSHPKVNGMSLSFFLLKPVKRITEYPLLIQKLLDATPCYHGDFDYLEEALKRSRSLCIAVNEGMREKENSERLEWLQNHVYEKNDVSTSISLTFNSLTNSTGQRILLHTGLLTKKSPGKKKEIVSFLFNDFLLFTTPIKSLSNSQFSFLKHKDLKLKVYKKPMFLNESEMIDEPSSLDISFKTNTSIITYECLSINDKTLWMSKWRNAYVNSIDSEKQFLSSKEIAQSEEKKLALGRVLVNVTSAENLFSISGKINPYCQVSLGSQRSKTSVLSNTTNPIWNASMQFWIKDLHQDVLCFTLFAKDYFSPDEFLGRTELRIKNLLEAKSDIPGPVGKVLPLLETKSGSVTFRADIQLFND